jgi:hypothetical protein
LKIGGDGSSTAPSPKLKALRMMKKFIVVFRAVTPCGLATRKSNAQQFYSENARLKYILSSVYPDKRLL